MAKDFAVIYRSGGTWNFKWRRVLTHYADRTDAITEARRLERMGFLALVHDAKALDSIGLPETYEADELVADMA